MIYETIHYDDKYFGNEYFVKKGKAERKPLTEKIESYDMADCVSPLLSYRCQFDYLDCLRFTYEDREIFFQYQYILEIIPEYTERKYFPSCLYHIEDKVLFIFNYDSTGELLGAVKAILVRPEAAYHIG